MNKSREWDINMYYRNGLVFFTTGASGYCGWDVELNLPLNFKQAGKILDRAVELCIAEKKILSERVKFSMYNREMSIRKFQSLVEPNQPVWRLILTDTEGRYPEDPNCELIFRKQISEDNETIGIELD